MSLFLDVVAALFVTIASLGAISELMKLEKDVLYFRLYIILVLAWFSIMEWVEVVSILV